MNELIDHQSYTFFLLAPLIRWFPKAETLLVVQAAWLALPGVIVYYLALQYLPRKHWATSALPLLAWFYNPIRNANSFDFHPETMMLPLFLAGIWGRPITAHALPRARMGGAHLRTSVEGIGRSDCRGDCWRLAFGIFTETFAGF